jgi:cytoskeletal protein CcmA (bactofilin family)
VSHSSSDSWLRGRRPARAQPRGSAYLIALAALVVGLTLGLALMAAGSQALRAQNGLERSRMLSCAALGGLEYGYWAFTYGAYGLPTDLTTTLGECTLLVQVVDNTRQIPDTIRVTSTASCAGRSVSITRVYGAKKLTDVFLYAVASNGSETESDAIICGADPGGEGDVYINGNVKWQDSRSAVYGTVYAAGSINSSLFAWAKQPNQPLLAFPAIDLSYYQARANVIYTRATTLINPTFAQPFTLVYVDGDLTIRGTVTGTGTIVVNGRIEVDGSLVYAQAGRDKIALIATDDIRIGSAAQTVSGILYSEGKVSVRPRSTDLSVPAGVLAGASLDIHGTIRVVHDPDLTDEMKRAMQLPGHTA